MKAKPTLFDSARIARFYARAQKRAVQFAFLRQRTVEDLQDRLSSITRTFNNATLISPFAVETKGLPKNIKTCAFLPALPPQSQDMLISLLHLHMEEDLPTLLRDIYQSLRPDGLFLGALFAERTLHELRAVLLAAESECRGGAQARIVPFAQIKSLGALLQQTGFALPVVDVDRVVVRYDNLLALLHDLRGMGQGNPLSGPIKPLRRDVLQRAEEIYVAQYGDEQGKIPATFEVCHLCGWSPHESQQQPLKPGSAQVSLTQVIGPNAKPAGPKQDHEK